MADVYYGVDGKPINSGDTPAKDSPITHYDVKGNPVGLSFGPSSGPISQSPVAPDVGPDYKDAPGIVPPLLSAIGGASPIPGGSLIGAALGELLKHAAPDTFNFGEKPSMGGSALNVGLEGVAQGVIPKFADEAMDLARNPRDKMTRIMASKIGRRFPAVKEGLSTDISKTLSDLRGSDSQAIEDAANNAMGNQSGSFTKLDYQPPDNNITIPRTPQFDYAAPTGQITRTGPGSYSRPTVSGDASFPERPSPGKPNSGRLVAGEEVPGNAYAPGTIGEKLTNIAKDPGSVEYSKLSKETLSDVTKVQQFKAATGEPYTVEKLALNKVIGKGQNGTKFDPDSITNELNGANSDIYNEAITPQTRKVLDSTLTDLKANSGSNDRLLQVAKGKLILSAASLGAGIYTGHVGAGTAIAGGILLPNYVFSKLMSDPNTAQLVNKAVKTGLSAPESNLIQKALLYSLRGSMVYVMTPEGQEKAVVGENGQLQYPSK